MISCLCKWKLYDRLAEVGLWSNSWNRVQSMNDMALLAFELCYAHRRSEVGSRHILAGRLPWLHRLCSLFCVVRKMPFLCCLKESIFTMTTALVERKACALAIYAGGRAPQATRKHRRLALGDSGCPSSREAG